MNKNRKKKIKFLRKWSKQVIPKKREEKNVQTFSYNPRKNTNKQREICRQIAKHFQE